MCFRGRTVDLVSQEYVGENRPLGESEVALAMFIFVQQRGAGDVRGHQVRRELHAGKIQRHGFRQTADHQGLGQSRNALDHTMSSGKEGRKDLIDHVGLAHDYFPYFGLNGFTCLGKRGDCFGITYCGVAI